MLKLVRNNLKVLSLVFLMGALLGANLFAAGGNFSIGKYSNANAVILMDDISFTVNKDGSTIQKEHEIIKVLSEKGIQKYSKVYRIYLSSYQDVVVNCARIIKPNGQVLDLNNKKFITRVASLKQSSIVYKDLYVLTIDFSKVQVNDTIEYELINTDKKPLIKNNYWGISFTEDDVPILETRFTVNLHKDASKFKWAYGGPKKEKTLPKKKILSDGVQYKWIFKDRQPLINEPNSPGLRDKISYIMVTTSSSWQEISSEFYKALKVSIVPDYATKVLVKRLLKGKKSSPVKLSTLLNYIRKRKNINLPFNPSIIVIGKPKDFIRSDALTKMNTQMLFVAMLRSAGFEAYPALVSDRRFGLIKKSLPSPYQFNKVITAVKIGSKFQYIDASSPFNQAASLQAGLEGQELLVLKSPGSKIAMVPVSPAYKNKEIIKAQAQLSSDGSVGVSLYLKETGTRKVFWDTFLNLLKTPGSQRAVFGKLVSVICPGARVLGFNKEDDPQKGVLDIEISFMAENYPMVSGNYWIVKMPILPAQKMAFLKQNPKERKYPVVLGSTAMELKTFTMFIPEEFKIKSLPGDINFSNSIGSLKVESRSKKDKIYYKYVLRVDKVRIPVNKFREIQDLYGKAYKAGREVILLEKVK